MTQLYLKLDHIAGLRSAGGGREPEPAVAASLAELEGVGGITIHLHSDRSTVHLRDIQVLKETLSVPLNLELTPSMKNRQHALDLRPDSITLIKEPMDVRADRWPLDMGDRDPISTFIEPLKDGDILSSLLVKPSIDSVRWAGRIGPDILMLDTSSFALAKTTKEKHDLFQTLQDCVRLGRKLNMDIHAGGGLGYRNVSQIAQLNISSIHVGHAVVARAVMVGMAKAVRDLIAAMGKEA